MSEEEVPSNKDSWDMIFFQAVFLLQLVLKQTIKTGI